LNKFFLYIQNNQLISGDNSFAQLFRTYIVGAVNLVIGLILNYIFQFFIFQSIEIPLRTYLTSISSFSIGVIVSYFLSRKIIFRLSTKKGNLKEFFNFTLTNLINLIFPLLIWYILNLYRPEIQENELQFLVSSIIISSIILPIKYIIYKFFVFKDSLES
jgi:putative flippase GtrA